MAQAAALLFLRAVTGVHAGVGQEYGAVDLPIQRERVTGFPVIRGPSLKGAMRQHAAERGLSRLLETLFGPPTNRASDHAGALSVGDARLLLFPMRSLQGTFAWLTCPYVIKRLRRDLVDCGLNQLLGLDRLDVPIMREPCARVCTGSRVAYLPKAANQSDTKSFVVVEDHGFEIVARDLDPIATTLARAEIGLEEEELLARLALVRDDEFQQFTSFCTEVVTRVRLREESKTTEGGALWTEELLPAESTLAALVLCADARRPASWGGQARADRNETEGLPLLQKLCAAVRGRFQIGGNETIGYGVCDATWLGPVSLDVGQQTPEQRGDETANAPSGQEQ